jgi:hypothetical protein
VLVCVEHLEVASTITCHVSRAVERPSVYKHLQPAHEPRTCINAHLASRCDHHTALFNIAAPHNPLLKRTIWARTRWPSRLSISLVVLTSLILHTHQKVRSGSSFHSLHTPSFWFRLMLLIREVQQALDDAPLTASRRRCTQPCRIQRQRHPTIRYTFTYMGTR